MSGTKHWLTPDWPAPANIHAATTLRTGGVSCGAYASLNPAMHVGDDAELVMQNRQLIKEWLDLLAIRFGWIKFTATGQCKHTPL